MRTPRFSRNPWIGRSSVYRWALALVMASLAACASHRGDPPKCKGTFTPINQPSSVAANGSQR
jgi:hypothetical protein